MAARQARSVLRVVTLGAACVAPTYAWTRNASQQSVTGLAEAVGCYARESVFPPVACSDRAADRCAISHLEVWLAATASVGIQIDGWWPW